MGLPLNALGAKPRIIFFSLPACVPPTLFFIKKVGGMHPFPFRKGTLAYPAPLSNKRERGAGGREGIKREFRGIKLAGFI